ncbi:MFS transporter [Actinocorallia aurea]
MSAPTTWRTFGPAAKVLFVNQFGINLGFYLLMPYLADHLARGAGLALWAVGLVLGVRNLSQQGLFLIGGTLADRLGCKPLIMLGCGLRVAGFGLFAFATSVPALVAASALTGLAGALFNPAARAYLAHTEADRRVEAFAMFNVFYQAGILLGPLAGLALLRLDFRAVSLTAAGVFAALTLLQWRRLPVQDPPPREDRPVLTDWRAAFGDRAFLAFAAVMTASYALSFQIYLALPLEAARLTGRPAWTVALFAVTALVALAGQLRLTAWSKARYTPGQAMARGLLLMGAAFIPPGIATWFPAAGAPALLLCAALLGVGTALVFPFEMAAIAAASEPGLVGTYYGVYNLLSGLGILAANLLTGALLDTAAHLRAPWLPWSLLALAGLAAAAALRALDRRSPLTRPRRTTQAPAAEPR